MGDKLTLEQVRAKSASKLSGLLCADRAAAEALIDFAYACGVPIVITQGLRTIDEQNALYAQGRTTRGQIVTNARGGYSYHNFGVAIDFALLLPDGGVSWDTKRDGDCDGLADWGEVVAQAKRLGWDWGGDWRSFTDLPHFEMTFGLSTADYRAGKRPTQAQLDAALARVKALKETEGEDDEMTTEEKAKIAEQFKALQETVETQTKRIETLEARAKMGAIPTWALPACENAKKAGFIDTTADGSYDFYRLVTLLDRAGMFVKKGA
ncbi:M15 family metallopeptidase [Paenibacillus sabinae]|uniref:L-alanyl-D-glutamate peptidase n=1 Tax=Paenibacillus sabinae T27 TaxID=1268072 RepID=X4ZHI2_9BACL|nr:M15 family metallopeptidase [Paenibacillus sabinae]AHV98971.1 L-alanyl-D-glutamate peptidase [Paenibacillus sabinae T27]